MASAAVVEGLDVVEDLGAQLRACWPGAPVDQLLLERREEALGDRIIEAILSSTPWGSQRFSREQSFRESPLSSSTTRSRLATMSTATRSSTLSFRPWSTQVSR